MAKRQNAEQFWHSILTGIDAALPLVEMRAVLGLHPSNPRCKFCNEPFPGPGAPLMRLVGQGPSTLTHHL